MCRNDTCKIYLQSRTYYSVVWISWKWRKGGLLVYLTVAISTPSYFAHHHHGTCNSRDSRHNTRKTGGNVSFGKLNDYDHRKKWFWAESSLIFFCSKLPFSSEYSPLMIQQTLLTWLCWLKLDLRINDINCIIDQLFTNRCSIWWYNLIKYLLVEYLQMF